MMRQALILLVGLFASVFVSFTVSHAQNKQTEFGKCGYFADAVQGRQTANGERYDKTLLTASHKSLPFGTNIRVTRLDNKKSVVVRINDRGPFMDGYVVDVSRKAAETLGLLRDGVAKVKIEVVDAPPATAQPVAHSAGAKTLPASLEQPTATASTSRVSSASDATAQLVKPKPGAAPAVTPTAYSTVSSPKPQVAPLTATPPPAPKVSELYQIEIKAVPSKSFGLQLAVLSNSENLFQEINKLQTTWPGKVIVSHDATGAAATFKLILGPYATRKEAEAQQSKASAKGHKKSFVVEFE